MTRLRGPGPNRYILPSTVGLKNHDPTRERAPGYTFGSRYSYSTTYVPGPYYIQSGLSNRGPSNNAGFTLFGRPKRSIWEIAAESSPGPAYQVNSQVIEKRTPAYSFGLPYKHNYQTGGPGPNSYSLTSDLGKTTKGVLIGQRVFDSKNFAYDFARTPGPAYYGNPYACQKKGPTITMGRRYNAPVNKDVTPGPNAYNPSFGLTNLSSPRFSMGVRHHEDVITLADVSE